MSHDTLERHLLDLGIQPTGPSLRATPPEDIEQRTGQALPDALRWLFTRFGGSRFPEGAFYFDRRYGQDVMIGWLLDRDEILDALDTWEDVLPANLVPIANDGGDNLLLVDGEGAVWFHQHDKAEPPYLVDESLEHFLGSLHREQQEPAGG